MADVYKFTMDMTKVLGAPEEDKPNGLMTSLYPKKRPTPADPQVAAKPKADGVQPTAMTKLDTLKSDFARIAIETQGEEEINKLYANQWDKSPTTFDRIRTNLLDRWGADTTVEPSPPRDTPAKPQMERPKRPYMLDASNMPDIPSIIDDVPVADAGEGLMSKPLTDDDMGLPGDRSTTETDMAFNTAFVTKMANSEGTVDHIDSLGIPTLGYGILPATARKYGFNPDSAKYSDRKVLAGAVYDAMHKEAKTSYPDVFANLNESQNIGVLSLYINLGELPRGVVTALSSATPDFDAARDSLSTVVLGSPRDNAGNRKKDSNKNTIYTSNKGLSKRRAGEYNILMEGQSGFIPVKTVSVEGTKQTPVFVWKDKDDKEIRRYTPTVTGQGKVYQGLDDSSTMTDVRV
jgi:hypothetical protein